MGVLKIMGAQPKPDERMVHSGKIVTAAGVSAGIDLALWLAGEIVGHERAEAIQLTIEYDPHPPFDAGQVSKASKETQKLAKEKKNGGRTLCRLFSCADQIDEAPPGNLVEETPLVGRHAMVHPHSHNNLRMRSPTFMYSWPKTFRARTT
jgi:hypothetical protein